MRTRAKKKHVAGDRARRENVPGHILSFHRKYQKITEPHSSACAETEKIV